MKLNLGCGQKPLEGFLNVDLRDGPGVDIVWDLEKAPWPEEMIGAEYIRASHVFEHIVHFDRFRAELWRSLLPGGIVRAWVPYGIAGWVRDPMHVHPWTEETVARLVFADGGCILTKVARFEYAEPIKRMAFGFPWWHLRHYIREDFPVPKSHISIMEFALRKVSG